MSAQYIQANDLLDLADELVGKYAGAGRPRAVRLRRGVSTAYYALFHTISQHASQRLLGTDEWTETHSTAARWITHTDLRVLADAANGRGNSTLVQVMGSIDPRLADIAQNFIDLQDMRHDADYNDFLSLNRTAAVRRADAARTSVTAASALFTEEEASYDRFVRLAMGGVKIARARR